jgi:hypothetical protein
VECSLSGSFLEDWPQAPSARLHHAGVPEMHLLTAKNLAELHLSGNNQTAKISAQDFSPTWDFQL